VDPSSATTPPSPHPPADLARTIGAALRSSGESPPVLLLDGALIAS